MGVTTILIRAILLFLSLISFIPQYHLIWSRQDCSGISLYYVLFNLIAFTEQFALGLHYIVDNVEVSDTIVHSPPTAGDWLNFCQLAIVWICYSILFISCLSYPPERPAIKRTVSAIYISFLLISIAPVVFESFLPPPGDSPEHDGRWFSAIFFGVHTMFISPIVTIIGFASLFAQAREIRSSPSLGALSIAGLAIQAVVFAVVALYWPLRMTIPREFWDMSPLRRLITWYQLVGWAAVDNAIFAIVQAVLLWIAMHRRGGVQRIPTNGETEPLLYN